VRSEAGEVVGVVVVGMPLNDERLGLISRATSGQALAIGVVNDGATLEVIAQGSDPEQRPMFDALRAHGVVARAATALKVGRAIFDDEQAVYAAEPLQGYATGNVVLMAALSLSLVPSIGGLLWPLLAVTLLGLVLVTMAGFFLGNYLSEPIAELEEGLLSVINGRNNHRFDIEHPDLGGLVFRINSLLNAFMGVPETDADGRTSVPPGAQYREAEGP
jgi:hypothetical protein